MPSRQFCRGAIRIPLIIEASESGIKKRSRHVFMADLDALVYYRTTKKTIADACCFRDV